MLDRRTEFTACCPWLGKRRRALLESIPPRNSQPKLVEVDERRGRPQLLSRRFPIPHRIDRFPCLRKLIKKVAARRPPSFALPVAPQTRRGAHNPAPSASVSCYRLSPGTCRSRRELRPSRDTRRGIPPRTSASS